MKKFNAYLTEAKSFAKETQFKPMVAKHLVHEIGKAKFAGMVKHKYHSMYADHGGMGNVVYKHRINSVGYHEVEAYPLKDEDKTEDGKYRPKMFVRFNFSSKHKPENAHVFKRTESDGWTWSHSEKEIE
jgi:hypothetical protein